MPADKAETRPESEPIVATPVLLLLQVPPAVASVSVVEKPIQPLVVPFIPPGTGFTVTLLVAVQLPMGSVYVIVAVPVAIPLASPVTGSMLAMPGALLLQAPPAVGSVIKLERPIQRLKLPMIATGDVFTVTITEEVQL